MLQRITSSSQLHSLKFKNKPDDPEKYIRAKYMYQVIKNVKAKLNSLTATEVAAIYKQAIEDYTNEENFVVITGESKPTKPKLSLVR
jgi:hypothetical protein